MRLLSFELGGQPRLGALTDDDTVVDLNRAYACYAQSRGIPDPAELADTTVPPDMIRFLNQGKAGVKAAGEALKYVEGLDAGVVEGQQLKSSIASLKLLPPVPRPPKIICVARNYTAHAKEAGREISEIPILFARFPKTLIASGDPIVRPKVSEQLDWEGELAVVIGKPGRDVKKSKALEHVAGYSIFNDATVRDFQFRTAQYTAGKNFSASGPFGPYLATPDEIAGPDKLDLKTEVNGKEVQSANTGDMLFDVATIVSHISEFIELEVGDVIPMGTPAGVGFTRKPPQFLRPGDNVSITLTGLGTLSNPVIAEEDIS
jgi:2-keto-4-pentenoate hydratase/2-oxohepta-3-ene-1,7-dioic acid hydratase in catechol pathway